MSPRKRAGSGRDRDNRGFMMGLAIVILLLIGFAMAFQSNIRIEAPLLPAWPQIPLKPSEDIELERKYGPFAPVVKFFSDLAAAITGKQRESGVGLEAEIGYKSTTGESMVFLQKFSGVGLMGMSGIFVKPSLGDYKQLKLYDADRGSEGEVWVKPVVRIRTFEGVPASWSVSVRIKIVSDGEVIDERVLVREGSGTPPEKIDLDKVSVRGKAFYALLLGEKEIAKKLIRREVDLVPGVVREPPRGASRQICFHADYVGIVRFEEEEEPSVKEVKNIRLGCFNFEFKQTGAFEMIVERNITVAPLAEVILAGESGMRGMTPVVETRTIEIPYTTMVIQGQTVTIYNTVTQEITRWRTTTTTVTTTVIMPGPERVVTTTVTVTTTVVVDRRYLPGYYAYSAVTILWPYSEFIFIAGG